MKNKQQEIESLITVFENVVKRMKALDEEPKAELTTWEECAKVVKPRYYSHTNGTIHTDHMYLSHINAPSEKCIKSMYAFLKLMTIAEALNGKYEEKKELLFNAYVEIDNSGKLYAGKYENPYKPNPIRFTSRESAQHSIDHFKQLWMDYFMVES